MPGNVTLRKYNSTVASDYTVPSRPYIYEYKDKSGHTEPRYASAEEIIWAYGLKVDLAQKKQYDLSPYFVGKLLFSDVLVRKTFGLEMPEAHVLQERPTTLDTMTLDVVDGAHAKSPLPRRRESEARRMNIAHSIGVEVTQKTTRIRSKDSISEDNPEHNPIADGVER